METGQTVSWVISGKERKGIYRQRLSDQISEVICTEFDGRRFVLKCNVETKLLTPITI